MEREVARAALAKVRGGADVVDPHENIALLDDLALSDKDRRHDAAFEILHDLGLLRRDHAAFAARDLLERRPARPGEEDDEERDDGEEEEVGQELGPQVLDRVAAGRSGSFQ